VVSETVKLKAWITNVENRLYRP